MSQAFDTVSHRRLWLKLVKLGVSNKVINTLKSIYSIANAKVRTNYGISEPFPIQKGVLQGETVSPILWNLYLEDLVQVLSESNTLPVKIIGDTIHALLYADDIILLAYTPAELQKKINILSAYLKENGLRVNLTKTKYMIFSKFKDTERLSIKWDNEVIERVPSYVYLGVPFTEQLNFEFVKNYFVKKSEIALKDLESLIYRSKMDNFSSIMSLFYSLVRSVFSYCAPIWGVLFSDCYEKLRIQFLKRLFLLPITTPAFFIRLELGLKTSEIFFLKGCLKYMINLNHKNKDSLMYKAYTTMKCIVEYKKSWYKSIMTLCNKWNCIDLLEVVDNEDISISTKLRKIYNELTIIEEDSVKFDIVNMRKTKLLSVYNLNKTHCVTEPFLNDNFRWAIKQLIMQLKLGISHITLYGKVARLRKLEFLYSKVDSSTCQLCGKEDESTYHVIFCCPHYVIERKKYVHTLNNFEHSLKDTDYLKLFNNLSTKESLSLYNFFNCALTRRRLYLEDLENT
jgi:hypothetical protein